MIVPNCFRMFLITYFLNLVQFDAKLARVQTKAKPYPDATLLPQSIYRRVRAPSPGPLLRKITSSYFTCIKIILSTAYFTGVALLLSNSKLKL